MARALNDRAFVAFVAASSSRLQLLAQHLSADQVTAGDITRTVLENVYRKWDRWGSSADPYAYARRLVVQLSTEQARQAAAPPPTADHQGPAPTPRLSTGDLATGDLAPLVDRVLVRRVLAELTPRDRAIVVLRYLEDMPPAAIGQQLGIRKGLVEPVCDRALAQLHKYALQTREGEA